jgi:drug/metabolite transporter (DMT)-like permease
VAFAHVYIPGDGITPRKLGGTLIAFVGVVALFGESLRLELSKTSPMLAIVGSTVCAAAAGVATKRHGATLHAAALNAPAMLVGAIVLAAAAVVSGEGLRLPNNEASWWAVAYLAMIGSVVSFLVYFSLLKTWTVTSLSFVSVFTPVIALVLGFVFLDERPTLWTAVGALLILVGVTLALWPERQSRSVHAKAT